MCDALRELFKDELDEKLEDGKNLINTLSIKLFELGRIDDFIKSAHDKEYQQQLLLEFDLIQSLTDTLQQDGNIELMLDDYNRNHSSILYESAIEMIIRSNPERFNKEDIIMCDALRELFKDELDKVREDGKEIGKEDGKNLINTLSIKLFELGRIDDFIKSAHDKEYQQQLLLEFNLI